MMTANNTMNASMLAEHLQAREEHEAALKHSESKYSKLEA